MASQTIAVAVEAPPLDHPSLYINRELSWLEFNNRVLEEAFDRTNPLLERLKFIAICTTNLDEFFMIRVAALKQQVEAEVIRRSDDGLTPAETLAAISEKLRVALKRQTACLQEMILPEMAGYGIRVLRIGELNADQRSALRVLFEERVYPVLTPLAVDSGHPFPYISNLSLSLAVEMIEHTDEGELLHFARVKVPPSLPRFIPVEGAPEGEHWFVTLEDVIAYNLDDLFPGMIVSASHLFRVTRDADLDLQEDEADDLLRAIESELRRRRFGEPVRLEVSADMPPHLIERLLEALQLEEQDLYKCEGLLGLSDLMSLSGIEIPNLHYEPFTPSIPRRFIDNPDIFAVMREGDILLHHPYDSFEPVVHFVREAADDPQVLAIKMTLYRTSGSNSPIVTALMQAAENGKQVAVLIELKARFDEENNINWARHLERVGAHVVYGFAGLKTHGKVTLVVRSEPDGLRRYMHFGTGNYNERTGRLYADLSLFTCRPELGGDATELFNSLTGFSKVDTYDELLVAPVALRKEFSAMIDREREHALAGRPSGIRAKINSLTDERMVAELYRASQAGVPIQLNVRGMCKLRPGLPGVSETISVQSIVGRFLEHSRIYIFENAGNREVYIGSADLMGRNLDRRVETIVPVLDQTIQATICDEIWATFAADNQKSRILRADGTYVRRQPRAGEAPVNSQRLFLERAQAKESSPILAG
ncbi:MAG TPA: polyphosphate kinase 1 [Candidatus Baltobacteraceae bacterium]|jgi:polyphosphate kinase